MSAQTVDLSIQIPIKSGSISLDGKTMMEHIITEIIWSHVPTVKSSQADILDAVENAVSEAFTDEVTTIFIVKKNGEWEYFKKNSHILMDEDSFMINIYPHIINKSLVIKANIIFKYPGYDSPYWGGKYDKGETDDE